MHVCVCKGTETEKVNKSNHEGKRCYPGGGESSGISGQEGDGIQRAFPSTCTFDGFMLWMHSHLFLCIIKVESKEHFLEQLLYARHKAITVISSHLKQLYVIITIIIIVINLITVKDSKIQGI